MNIKKWIKTFLIIVVITIGVCGCMNNTIDVSVNNEGTTLTERQIEILKANGLSTDYCRLTSRQQMTIDDIEMMLCAVEHKYGLKFVYVDYTATKYSESGVLTAIPYDSKNLRDMFTVKRLGDNEFTDTYINVIVRDLHEKAVKKIIENFATAENFKFYSSILDTSLTYEELPNVNLSNNAKADMWLFLDGLEYHNAEMTEISNSITDALKKEELYGSLYIVVVNGDCFRLISENNFTDYLSEQYVIQKYFTNVIE